MKCYNTIEITPYCTTVCVKELTHANAEGKLVHDGPCEPERCPSQYERLLQSWWAKHEKKPDTNINWDKVLGKKV